MDSDIFDPRHERHQQKNAFESWGVRDHVGIKETIPDDWDLSKVSIFLAH